MISAFGVKSSCSTINAEYTGCRTYGGSSQACRTAKEYVTLMFSVPYISLQQQNVTYLGTPSRSWLQGTATRTMLQRATGDNQVNSFCATEDPIATPPYCKRHVQHPPSDSSRLASRPARLLWTTASETRGGVARMSLPTSSPPKVG